MSSLVDVGDALEMTFNTAPGAEVLVSWLDPDQVPVIDQQEVTEVPAGSGKFPQTFLPTAAGMWTAWFTASGTATADERYYIRAEAPSPLPPLAAVGDVGAQQPLTTAQEQLTATLLKTASKMVRARYPVDAAMAAGRLDASVVALGVTNMVLRVLRNPKSLRSETTGPFSRTYDTAVASGFLAINAEDAANFTPTPVPTWAPPSSIRMTPGLVPTRESRCCGY